jgi:hypothetical protein
MPSPISMPETQDYIDARSSKSKAMTSLSQYEAKEQNVYLGIRITKKILNGKVIVCGTLSRDSSSGSLPEEYTDMGKFKSLVAETVNGLADQLTSSKAGS